MKESDKQLNHFQIFFKIISRSNIPFTRANLSALRNNPIRSDHMCVIKIIQFALCTHKCFFTEMLKCCQMFILSPLNILQGIQVRQTAKSWRDIYILNFLNNKKKKNNVSTDSLRTFYRPTA